MPAFHTSADRFVTILDTAVVGVLESDLAGRLVYANRAACGMLAMPAEALIGRSVVDLTAAPSREDTRAALDAVRGGSPGLSFRKHYVRGDGALLAAETTLTTVRDDAGAPVGIVAILIDRTSHERAEAMQREREALQTYLVHLGDTLRPLADAGDIQAAAARVVGEHLGASRILYAEVAGDDADDVFIVRHDYRQPGVPPVEGRHRFDDFGAFIAKEFRKGRTLAIGNVRDVSEIGPDELAVYDALCFSAFLAVPLVKGGRIVAYLAANQTEPRAWSAHDVAVIEETAERTWAAVQRAYAEAALREADHRKDEFLATLAHELRNPLSPIRTGVEILRLTAGASPQSTAVLDMMSRQVTHMVRLVDDLLDVSRISRGKIHLQLAPMDVREAIAVGIESVRPALDAAGHALEVLAPPEPVYIHGDAVRIAQILSNLLSNAIKYSAAGGRITIALAAGADAVDVRVTDTGVGIAADVLPQVFDLFSQAQATASLSQGGLGLGLAIARRLAQLHGGRLVASSAGAGQGAQFTLTLPRLPAASTTRGPLDEDADALAAAPVPPREVLVVDDNRDAADTLSAVVGLLGHRVRVRYDGAAALAAAAAAVPDIVFCDIGMPEMSGYDVAAALRAMPAGDRPFLVAVTGWGTAEDRARALAAGFDEHVPKPIESATVRRLLAAAHGPDRARTGNGQAQ
jgi:PAS domain S-box-containing protein